MLGRKIRELRKTRDMSQGELARAINVTPSYIGHLERGTRETPSRDVIHLLARALEVPVDELLIAAGYELTAANHEFDERLQFFRSELGELDEDDRELIYATIAAAKKRKKARQTKQ